MVRKLNIVVYCLPNLLHLDRIIWSVLRWFVCSIFFFFKQKTAYEMRISDWSSDVCSSDLRLVRFRSPQTLPSPRTCSGVQRAAREDATAPIPSMLHIELKIIVNIPIGTTQQKTSVPPL